MRFLLLHRTFSTLLMSILHFLAALRFTSETEQGDNDSIKAPSKQEARPMRAPSTDNSGVRRRRRAKPAADAAPPAGGCCSAP